MNLNYSAADIERESRHLVVQLSGILDVGIGISFMSPIKMTMPHGHVVIPSLILTTFITA